MEWSDSLKQAFKQARIEASKRKLDGISIAILFKIFLEQEDQVSEIYRKVSQNPQFLLKFINSQLNKEMELEYVEYQKMIVSKELFALLKRAEEMGPLLGAEKLDIPVLLIALMDLESNPIRNYLVKKNISKNDLLNIVQHLNDQKEVHIPNQRAEANIKHKSVQHAFDEFGLEMYGTEWVELASQGELLPVIGREEEIQDIIQILARRTKSNPILIGEAGIGKTAIVQGLAQRIAEGRVPKQLKDTRILALDVASVLAGASMKGELEKRLQSIFQAVEESDGRLILFIDEIHHFLNAGQSDGGMTAGNLMKPMLARGRLKTIGTTTYDEYRKHIEGDKALARRFQMVRIEEPTLEETKEILEGLKDTYEDYHDIKISDEALTAAVNLSKRYINNRRLPDKAIDALDEAAAHVAVTRQSPPKELLELEKTLDKISDKETKEAMDLAREITELEKRWHTEKEVFAHLSQVEDAVKILQTNLAEAKKNLNVTVMKELENQLKQEKVAYTEAQKMGEELIEKGRLIQTEVGVDAVAAVISKRSGVPIEQLNSSDQDRLLNLENRMKKQVMGQDDAIEMVTDAILRAFAGVQNPDRPLGSFIFLGPTGVGKTEIAKVLADELFGSKDQMIRIDMSEYMEKHSVSRLVGAPPGYVGYDEGGQLTESVRQKPYSIILLDEIEKAHPDVFNILLQVLDDGRITDAAGRLVDFKNTVIIMTSNMGSRILLDSVEEQGVITETAKNQVKFILQEHFRPEFLNRVDSISIFNPLEKNIMQNIIHKELRELRERLDQQGIYIEYEDTLASWINEKAYDRAYGARPIKRFIMNAIETPVARYLISGRHEAGKKIKLNVEYDKLVLK